MAILAPLQEGMQALPAEEVANEGARALRKVNLERFKAKLRDQYLEGKGVDASQALADAMGSIQEAQRRTSAPRTPTRHGCLTTPSSLWERGLFCPLELDDPEDIPNVGDIKEKYVPDPESIKISASGTRTAPTRWPQPRPTPPASSSASRSSPTASAATTSTTTAAHDLLKGPEYNRNKAYIRRLRKKRHRTRGTRRRC